MEKQSPSQPSISEALVREYLHRKNLPGTLKALEQEMPRGPESLSSRTILTHSLHLEEILRQRKKEKKIDHPSFTILELLVEHMQLCGQTRITKATKGEKSSKKQSEKKHKKHRKSLEKGTKHDDKFRQTTEPKQSTSDTKTVMVRTVAPKPMPQKAEEAVENKMAAMVVTSNVKSGHDKTSHNVQPAVSNEMWDSPSTTQPSGSWKFNQETSSKPQDTTSVKPRSNIGNIVALKQSTPSPHATEEPRFTRKSAFGSEDTNLASVGMSMQGGDDLLLEEVEDFAQEDESFMVESGSMMAGENKHISYKGVPLDHNDADALRILFHGSRTKTFNKEWRQGFVFNETAGMTHGLLQFHGGPCGVLAAVQAQIIKQLMMEGSSKMIEDVTPAIQREALINAMTRILWMVGGESQSVVVMTKREAVIVKKDPLEYLEAYILDSEKDLRAFLTSNISHFHHKTGNGVILFACSAVLSRGIAKVRSDMDTEEGRLMGRHGYCTQELVNLLLTGLAVSNVHDGVRKIDTMTLRGIPSRCDIGFLSLHEHYQYVVVGENYKTPRLPIWVICSESHFTVIFSHDPASLITGPLSTGFDMRYYDQLANQDHEYILSLGKQSNSKDDDDDFEIPLVMVLRTKYPDVEVDWNDDDPLL